jgi:hypothetical protein
MLPRLVGQQRRMGPAQNNEPATAAKSIGQVVDVAGVGGVARDADQVGRGVEIDGLVIFIDPGNPVRPANEAGQVGHGELSEAVALATSEGFDEAVLGGDQQDPHRLVPLDRSGHRSASSSGARAKPVGCSTWFLAVCRPGRVWPAKDHADNEGSCDDTKSNPLYDSRDAGGGEGHEPDAPARFRCNPQRPEAALGRSECPQAS